MSYVQHEYYGWYSIFHILTFRIYLIYIVVRYSFVQHQRALHFVFRVTYWLSPQTPALRFSARSACRNRKYNLQDFQSCSHGFAPKKRNRTNTTPGVLRDTSFFSATVCSVLIVCKEKAETYAEIDQLLLLMYIHGGKNDSPRIPRSFVTTPVLERHLFWMVSAPPPFAGASADSCDGTPAQCFQSLLQCT